MEFPKIQIKSLGKHRCEVTLNGIKLPTRSVELKIGLHGVPVATIELLCEPDVDIGEDAETMKCCHSVRG